MPGVARLSWFLLALAWLRLVLPVHAVTNVFFLASQITNLVATHLSSDTIASEGYLFTLGRDKLFTGGYDLTNPIGRSLRVNWPEGLEAQAITVGPDLGGARLTLTRQDGQPFDIRRFMIRRFMFRLLGNTGAAGAMLEIMPLINGEDALPDPLMYQATGIYGQTFTKTTPELAGYDTYKFTLYVDFALMGLTVVDPSVPPPVLSIRRESFNQAKIVWTPVTTNWVLQESTNLTSGTWTNSPSGWTNPVTIPATLPWFAH